MSAKVERTAMAAIVAVGGLAGVAIAGIPQLGSDDRVTVQIAGPESPEPEDIGTAAAESLESSTITTSSTTTTSPPTTTSTTDPPVATRAPAEVPVLVANGTRVAGAAARLSERIAVIGHPTLEPLSTRSASDSEVWFADGYELEAADLAGVLGLSLEFVRPIPDNLSFDPSGAALVVVIGPELARS
jgi:hypothetical protein